MDVVFCINEEFIKSLAPVDDNMAGKHLRSALVQAQEISLKSVIGSSLLDALKYRILNKQVVGDYKELLEKIQYYLAYTTLVNLSMVVGFKVANAGVLKTGDENMTPSTWTELTALRNFYQTKADFFCFELQKYLLNNKSKFPELDTCTCRTINSNLLSAASSGLWLGGARIDD